MKIDKQELPHIVVSACLEVHKQLGPHLVRDAYKECLAQELTMREIFFDREVSVEIQYKGRRVKSAFIFDFIIEHQLVVEVEAFVEGDLGVKEHFKDRLSSYLRLSGYETGFLVNFAAADIRNGIKRLIVACDAPALHWR